jgi:P4 family phage/plasmid primase-like protien
MRTYMLYVCVVTLASIIRAEVFYLLNGSGSNSKSKFLELLQQAVGDYYMVMSCAFLTQKRASSNSASPEAIKMKGKRFVVLQEPSEDEVINTGIMKEYTGGDRVSARGLFKDIIEFMPFYRMFMICNKLPEVKSDDGGTWRRIQSIEFTSKFLDQDEYVSGNPREFLKDTTLADKFPKWSSVFLSYLIYLWKEYKDKPVPIPDCVKQATKVYQYQNDPIQAFIVDQIEISEEEQSSPLCDSVFTTFKTWCHQQNISTRFAKSNFLTKLHTKLKKTIGECYSDPIIIQNFLLHTKVKALIDEDDYDALTPQEKMKITFDNWFSKTYDTIQGTTTKWEDIVQHFYDSHKQYKIETKQHIEKNLLPILQRRNMFKKYESHKVKGEVVCRSVIINCGLYLC